MTISNKELQINEEIRDKEVRVIDADGSQLDLGVGSTYICICDSSRPIEFQST